MNQRKTIVAAAAALALWTVTPAWAIRPFTLLEDGYPEATGQFEFENTTEYNWHTRNDTSSKELAVEHELEYGVSDHLTLRIAGSYVYEDSSEGSSTHFDAGVIEFQYFFTNPNTDPIGVSIIGAAEVQEREGAGFEGFLVLQKDTDNWTFTYNLGVVTDVENFFRGHDRATEGTLVNAFGLIYNVVPRVRIGAEISAESVFSEWSHYEDTNVLVGPVINITPNDKLWITAGVDYQVTGHADAPLYRAALIVGYYF